MLGCSKGRGEQCEVPVTGLYRDSGITEIKTHEVPKTPAEETDFSLITC